MARRLDSHIIVCTDRSIANCIGVVLASAFCGLAFVGTKGTPAGGLIISFCAFMLIAGILWIPVSLVVRLACMGIADALNAHPGTMKASLVALPVGIAAAFLLL